MSLNLLWGLGQRPQKKGTSPANAAWRRSRQAEAGAGCWTGTPKRKAPASLRRLEPPGDTTHGCAGAGQDAKRKAPARLTPHGGASRQAEAGAGQNAKAKTGGGAYPPAPPFYGFRRTLQQGQGSPKRSATSQPTAFGAARRHNAGLCWLPDRNPKKKGGGSPAKGGL